MWPELLPIGEVHKPASIISETVVVALVDSKKTIYYVFQPNKSCKNESHALYYKL